MVFAEVFVGFGGIRDGKSWLDCGRFVVNRGVLYGAVQAPRTCTLPVAIADSDVAYLPKSKRRRRQGCRRMISLELRGS